MAGQREILAKRVAFETVIRQKAPQVRMAGKEDPEHVPGLALGPVRGRIDGRHRRHGLPLANRGKNTHPHVVFHRQQLIDHLEALGPLRIVDGRQIGKLVERGVIVVTKRGQRVCHRRNGNFDHDLVLRHAAVNQRVAEQLAQMVKHGL